MSNKESDRKRQLPDWGSSPKFILCLWLTFYFVFDDVDSASRTGTFFRHKILVFFGNVGVGFGMFTLGCQASSSSLVGRMRLRPFCSSLVQLQIFMELFPVLVPSLSLSFQPLQVFPYPFSLIFSCWSSQVGARCTLLGILNANRKIRKRTDTDVAFTREYSRVSIFHRERECTN